MLQEHAIIVFIHICHYKWRFAIPFRYNHHETHSNLECVMQKMNATIIALSTKLQERNENIFHTFSVVISYLQQCKNGILLYFKLVSIFQVDIFDEPINAVTLMRDIIIIMIIPGCMFDWCTSQKVLM